MPSIADGTRVLPWANWSEWLELKNLLRDGELEEARARVSLYETRRRGSVPIAVVSSVAIACLLKNPSPDPYSQRLSLSMALARFVNGMTDRIQPRGQSSSAKSVYTLSVGLQLPLILVEIRHQSCHNLLPRLATLEFGAKQALVWLEHCYWEPQHTNIIQQLPQQFVQISKVFERNQNDADDEKMSFTQTGTATSVEQGGNRAGDIISKMQQIAERIEKRKQNAKRTTTVEKRVKLRTARWSECKNRESWKGLPLGLAPGQRIPPRVRNLKLKVIEGLEEEGKASSTGTSPNLIADREIEMESLAPKRYKKLNAADSKKVADWTTHFRRLLSHDLRQDGNDSGF